MKWIKLWVDGWLDGTLRLELTDAERAIWIDLLALAARSRTKGIIGAGPGAPYPHKTIAQRLGLNFKFFEATLEKLISQERVHENDNGIHIINWAKYQSSIEEPTAVDIPASDNSVTTLISTKEDAQQKLKDSKPMKDNDNKYNNLFNHWNSQGIIVHQKLTSDMRSVIKSALKDYSEAQIKTAIANYAEIVKGDEYYFKYKWTLAEFLSRRKSNNIERFLDLETAKENCREKGEKRGTNQKGSRGYQERVPEKYPTTEEILNA